ncbi:hypothetical protein B0H13DRAFT_2283808 [Mycena leptocephala]|nr:hypothetical protein B0H13DRAFT_2283808 [Mycena leptocephala]
MTTLAETDLDTAKPWRDEYNGCRYEPDIVGFASVHSTSLRDAQDQRNLEHNGHKPITEITPQSIARHNPALDTTPHNNTRDPSRCTVTGTSSAPPSASASSSFPPPRFTAPMSGLHSRKRHLHERPRHRARLSTYLHRAHDCSSAARRTDVCQARHLLRTALHRYLPAFDTTLHHRDGTPSCCIVIETSSSGAGPQAGRLPPSGNGSASTPARLAYTSSSAGRATHTSRPRHCAPVSTRQCIARGDMRIPHRAHDYIPALRSASSIEVYRALCYSPPRAMLPICICHLLLPAAGMYLAVCVQTQLAPLLAATQAVLAALVAHMVPPSPLPRTVFILDPPARRSSHPPSKNLSESGKGKEIRHTICMCSPSWLLRGMKRNEVSKNHILWRESTCRDFPKWREMANVETTLGITNDAGHHERRFDMSPTASLQGRGANGGVDAESPDVLDATTGCWQGSQSACACIHKEKEKMRPVKGEKMRVESPSGTRSCSSLYDPQTRKRKDRHPSEEALPSAQDGPIQHQRDQRSGHVKNSGPATRYPPSLTVSLSRKNSRSPYRPRADEQESQPAASTDAQSGSLSFLPLSVPSLVLSPLRLPIP